MRILLVEDDSSQAKLIEEHLQDEFPDCDVQILSTESAFRENFESVATNTPDLILIDVMLRWCDISDHMPPRPPECEDFSRAGIRCCKLIKADSRTRDIPVIVLTVLNNNNLGLPPGCYHVAKSSDFTQLISEMVQT